MELLEFTVKNYRSITSESKISLKPLTVLVGKNNEGKSNLLMALNVAMKTIENYPNNLRHQRSAYDWERDFPVQLKQGRGKKETIFIMKFKFSDTELHDFINCTGIRGNYDVFICIKYRNTCRFPEITLPKRGSSSYTEKSQMILQFVSNRISFNYIQAVRTEGMALQVLQSVISEELKTLESQPDYKEALRKVFTLQQEVLDNISSNLLEPLKVFLPQITEISIKSDHDRFRRTLRNDIDVTVNDGVETSIVYKGDGIKSLLALAILKERPQTAASSIIAIEEPESHLHSEAIHNLVEIIHTISQNNQVILTTHNPLFVQRNSLESNILVEDGKAKVPESISRIRSVLGVRVADNLINAENVFVVEGEDDKIILQKLLSCRSSILQSALTNNVLVIKSLAGAGNLSYVLNDLKYCLCKYFVLLDNDEAGRRAGNKAIENNLLGQHQLKYTICNGQDNSELEDCLKKDVYLADIKNAYSVDLTSRQFRGNNKWSERVKQTFNAQGSAWNEPLEKQVKLTVANAVRDSSLDIADILIEQKSGSIYATIDALEHLLSRR